VKHADEIRYAPFDRRLAGRMLAFLAPYRKAMAAALFLLIVLAGIQALQPYLVKVAIDRHIAVGDAGGLLGVAALYFGLLVLDLALGFLQTWLTAWIGQQTMHDLRERLFDHLQRLPVPFFDRQAMGRLVTRVTSDVEVLNDLFSSGVVAVLSDLLMLVAVAVTMFLVDPRLALVTLAVVPLILVVSLFCGAALPPGAAQRARVRRAQPRAPRRPGPLDPLLRLVLPDRRGPGRDLDRAGDLVRRR
jgi:ATP-binding cassette subfamily B multidrug efflux pump